MSGDLVDCQICYDKTKKSQIVSYGCEHKFCSLCVRTYLETQIQEGMIDGLTCPDPECHHIADQTLVKKSVSKLMYDRLEKLTLKEAVKDMQDVVSLILLLLGILESS